MIFEVKSYFMYVKISYQLPRMNYMIQTFETISKTKKLVDGTPYFSPYFFLHLLLLTVLISDGILILHLDNGLYVQLSSMLSVQTHLNAVCVLIKFT